MYYLYKVRHVGTPDSYIGVTTNSPKKRFACHISDAKRGSEYHLHRAIRKYGEKEFDLTVLMRGEDEKIAYLMEKRFIALFKPSYNMTAGGEGSPGFNPSKETRRLLSEIRTGHGNPFYGRHHTDIAKKKMSEGKLGRPSGRRGVKTKPWSEETRKKHSLSRKGRIPWNKGLVGTFKLSEESKRKIGDSKRGKKRAVTWGDKISKSLKGRKITWSTKKKNE